VRTAILVAGLVVLAVPATALGGPIGQRVAIGAFRGPQAARVQDAVEGALLRRYYLVPDSVVLETARKSGLKLQSDQDFAEVARSLNVQAFLTATVRKQRNWTVEMVVRKGTTGEAVARFDWTDRRIESLAAALARSTPRRLQALLANRPAAAAVEADEQVVVKAPSLPERAPTVRDDPPEDKPDPAEKAEKTVTVAEEGPGTAAPQPYFEVSAGSRIFSRTMSYVDNYSGLPGYRLGRATSITLDAAFHPFALIPGAGAWIGGLGLTGNVTYALGIGTQGGSAETPARTEVYGYEAGVRHRISVGVVDLLPHVSYLVDSFVASAADLAPDVRYEVVRAGLGTRLNLSSRAAVRATADYLYVLNAGPLTGANKFPRAEVRGVDLSLGAGYSFTETLEAQASVGLRRYGFDMKVEPGDALIAGGAIDEYLSMTLGLAYRPSLRSNRR
jgi:hypothetical protein